MTLEILKRICIPPDRVLEPKTLLYVVEKDGDILWANFNHYNGERTIGILPSWFDQGFIREIDEKPTEEEQEQWLDLLT